MGDHKGKKNSFNIGGIRILSNPGTLNKSLVLKLRLQEQNLSPG